MSNHRSRLDESFTGEGLRKNFSGRAGVAPDLDKITISESGELQPKANSATQLPQQPISTGQTSLSTGRSDGGSSEQ